MTFEEWFDAKWGNYHGTDEQKALIELFAVEAWDHQQNKIDDLGRRLESVDLLNALISDGYSFTIDYDTNDGGWIFAIFDDQYPASNGRDESSMDKAIRIAISEL